MSVSWNSATVLKLSFDRVRQPKQYSLEFAVEGKQGRHVPDMIRQRIPGSCCSRRKRAVTQCRTASCRHQQSRCVSRSEMTLHSKAGNWTNGLGKVAEKRLKWKDTISVFSVSQGSAEALIRWGEKIYHLLIACFLSNISAKYYENATMLSRVIAQNIGMFFSETQCSCLHTEP